MEGSGGEFGVTRRRELPLQVFDDVERQTADQRDDTHLPQKHPCCDKRKIKVFIEEGEGGEVAGQTDELCYDHEPVPRADSQRHHQELSED